MQLYKENIIDHYNHPRNFGSLWNANLRRKESNTLCGDIIELHIKTVRNKVKDIKFTGSGCAISIASASILTEFVEGKHISEIQKLKQQDFLDIIGIPLSSTRMKCALLAFYALKNSLKLL